MKDNTTIDSVKVVYIVSDIDKALAFEWIAERLPDCIHLSFILIGKKNTALESFLQERHLTYYVIADEDHPSFLARIAIGKAPRIGCNPPSKESSPIMRYLSKSSGEICPEAAKTPTAIVKS